MLKRDDVLKRKKGRKEDQKEERMKWGENEKKRKKEKKNKGKKKEIKKKSLSFFCLLARPLVRPFACAGFLSVSQYLCILYLR